MNTPHFVHIYQPPAQGTEFVAQHLAVGYTHDILALGGYDTASFTLSLNASSTEAAFQNYIGCVVRVYVDNPKEPIWEGYINRITYRPGGVVVTRSLDEMMNRVVVNFYNATSAAAIKTEQTVTTNNLVSQALFGVKQGSIEGGPHYAADVSHKAMLRNLYLALYAYPQVSMAASSGGDGVLEIECKGLQYMAWDWTTYELASTLTQAASTVFRRVTTDTALEAPPNAPLIYATGAGAGTESQYILANTSFNMPRGSQGGQSYLQFLQGLVEAGGSGARYVFGITTPDPNDGLRYVYYRPADTTVKYTLNAIGDAGRLRDINGQVVPPWLVTPDAGVRVNDILTGWDEAGDDPRIGYIERITYDADAGSIQWQTGDDITLEGAMQRRKRFKKFAANDPFAANPRQTI